MKTIAIESFGVAPALSDDAAPPTAGAGEPRVPIQRSYALAEAGAALADLSTAHKHGKLAIEVA